MLRFIFVIAIVLCCLTAGCSSIKIESDTTTEDMANKNEILAKQIRAEWSQKLNNAANDGVRALMVKHHIDSTTTIIINYGFRVADEWRRGNEGRGEDIEASEMRQVVDAWVARQKPILKAFEDNMEYGIQFIRQSQGLEILPGEIYPLFDSLADQYYDTYSIVFYPNHNVGVYEEAVRGAERRHDLFSEKLSSYFRKY
jgi:hypothetical protein